MRRGIKAHTLRLNSTQLPSGRSPREFSDTPPFTCGLIDRTGRVSSVARLSSDRVTDPIVVTVVCALRYARRVVRYSFTTTVRLSVSVAAMATQCFLKMVPTACLQSEPAPPRTPQPASRRHVRTIAQSTHARATIPYPFPEGRRADLAEVAEAIRNVWCG